MNISQKIATELSINIHQVTATISLLDEGATVPFIARYRKEATNGLDDTQLRQLEERLLYLREFNQRRDAILKTMQEKGQLTDDLEKQFLAADTKARLEDLYLPFKPKRVTKAQIARDAGLEPLANSLLSQPDVNLQEEAAKYLNPEKEISDANKALEGARYILIERFAENADLIQALRDYMWNNGSLMSQAQQGKEETGAKFKDYFNYQEPLIKVPSHRALAIFRGQQEDSLNYQIKLSDEGYCLNKIADIFNIKKSSSWLWQVVELTWQARLKPKVESDLLMQLRERAEEAAITVFKDNLKNLLMAPPAGKKNTLGLDPGIRTGVKVVVIDDTGKLMSHTVVFPHAPRNDWAGSMYQLTALCKAYNVDLVSIGNGTGSRETERLVVDMMKATPDLKLIPVLVSEAGASVYSASELAAHEFPDLDVSYRGAVSIARRLQDPLAELVKIDPKAIGVGQYQHDVNAVKLTRGLNAVLEDCVNAVGVDINTASVPLLKSIAGLNESVAKNIVKYREENGRFKNRDSIKKVPRLGDKAFQQAIGFLRIMDGENPLDASSVHPESYPIVEKILEKTRLSLQELIGNAKMINSLKASDFVQQEAGEITVSDIFSELKKPGRDPRPEFVSVKFQEGVETLADLKIGMQLEGMVTNVANFGAFVDIGVHQDGLVHISQLSNTFVSDPNTVVKVGQIVKVKVLEVDVVRKRIQLTMKLDAVAQKDKVIINKHPKPPQQKTIDGGFADLLQQALRR
jgi:uncharacterized protein